MGKHVHFVRVPVELDCPTTMVSAIDAVLQGEYEAGFFGTKLTIVDVGANVGSFTIWANMRWPQSRIHAYEPHPGTFQMLLANVSGLTNVTCHNSAVYPASGRDTRLFASFAGDGEAALVDCAQKSFTSIPAEKTMPVNIVHPNQLPAADVLKIDVEGAELEILRNTDLSAVLLILLEYQNLENRNGIVELLADDFSIQYERSFEWRRILDSAPYRRDLRGDYYGTMVLSNKRNENMRMYQNKQVAAGPASWPRVLELLRQATTTALRNLAVRRSK